VEISKDWLMRLVTDMKLNAEDGYNGPLDGATILLFKNNYLPTKDTVLADLTECTFTGYSRSSAVTWATPQMSSETGVPVIYGDQKSFICTATPDPAQSVYGWAIILEGTPDLLVGAELLETPELIEDGSFLTIVPRLGLNPTSDAPGGALAVT